MLGLINTSRRRLSGDGEAASEEGTEEGAALLSEEHPATGARVEKSDGSAEEEEGARESAGGGSQRR